MASTNLTKPKWHHKCDWCGAEATNESKYPPKGWTVAQEGPDMIFCNLDCDYKGTRAWRDATEEALDNYFDEAWEVFEEKRSNAT